jgi:hypothetical protein
MITAFKFFGQIYICIFAPKGESKIGFSLRGGALPIDYNTASPGL